MEVRDWPEYLPPHETWSDPFWQGLSNGKLLLPHCHRCNKSDYPPLNPRCPDCSDSVSWLEASGSTILWSWTTFHRVYFEGFPLNPPYTVLMVELEEGIRILASLSPDIDPKSLSCGMTMTFSPIEIQPGIYIPAFLPG